MIYFKPEHLTENVTKFTAYEDEKNEGYCLLRISDNTADVYELSFSSDKPYLVEGLLRSAFNYATLRNVYMGKCTCRNINEYLDKMNFIKNENEYYNDIPSILTGSCCK